MTFDVPAADRRRSDGEGGISKQLFAWRLNVAGDFRQKDLRATHVRLQFSVDHKWAEPVVRPDGRLLGSTPSTTTAFCHCEKSDPSTFDSMTTFALVHGAWHGGWCWGKVAPLLRQAGHDAVAPDLPIDDGSADFDTYADVMCGALHGCDNDVVVVGHSLGGPTAALVAARRPVRHLMYLCAVIPASGLSLIDQFQVQPDMITPDFVKGWTKGLSEPDDQGRTVWVNFDFVRKMFYADCDDRTVGAALDHLRPQAAHPWTLSCSLTEPPSVPCTYVVCANDQIITPEWSRRTARDIGADLVELPGSHSPLLSRPEAVVEVLLAVACRRVNRPHNFVPVTRST